VGEPTAEVLDFTPSIRVNGDATKVAYPRSQLPELLASDSHFLLRYDKARYAVAPARSGDPRLAFIYSKTFVLDDAFDEPS